MQKKRVLNKFPILFFPRNFPIIKFIYFIFFLHQLFSNFDTDFDTYILKLSLFIHAAAATLNFLIFTENHATQNK